MCGKLSIQSHFVCKTMNIILPKLSKYNYCFPGPYLYRSVYLHLLLFCLCDVFSIDFEYLIILPFSLLIMEISDRLSLINAYIIYVINNNGEQLSIRDMSILRYKIKTSSKRE